eukprot:4856404-Amphidinium_carterae.1
MIEFCPLALEILQWFIRAGFHQPAASSVRLVSVCGLQWLQVCNEQIFNTYHLNHMRPAFPLRCAAGGSLHDTQPIWN